MRSAALALPAVLAVALLTGCAGQTNNSSADDFQGDQKAVAQVVDDLGDAGAKRDGKEICNTIFARSVAAKLTRGNDDCQKAVEKQLEDAASFKLTVKKVTVDGNAATATVESEFHGEDTPRTLTFAKDGSAWRITGIQTPGA